MNTPNELLIQIGLRIKEIRALRQMTQEDLADATELYRTYIQRIEAGAAMQVSLLALIKIATALKIEFPSLFLKPENEPPKRVHSPQKLSRGRIQK